MPHPLPAWCRTVDASAKGPEVAPACRACSRPVNGKSLPLPDRVAGRSVPVLVPLTVPKD
ncbi:hypothetical protein SNL152K_9457 [Streptomyces sp. NL15-2K]|nr:hypothetical protein SNL152K_9457 [Streptomyces sp. NL15-2K]